MTAEKEIDSYLKGIEEWVKNQIENRERRLQTNRVVYRATKRLKRLYPIMYEMLLKDEWKQERSRNAK